MVVHGYSTLLEEIPLPGARARRLETPEGLRNDELGQHLSSLQEWAVERGTEAPALPAVLDHLRHVHWEYTSDRTTLSAWREWAERSHALLRVGPQSLQAADGTVLVGPGAVAGDVPTHPESQTRADRIRRDLAARDVIVPDGALPVRATAELRVRRPEVIGRRAVALVLTADYAISILEGRPLDWRSVAGVFPRAFADRTPTELALFTDADPALAARLKWGYEAAAQLMAACGRVRVGFATDFADQGQVWNTTVGIEEAALLPALSLVSAAEICEEWERCRALHHAVSTCDDEAVPGGVDPEIVRQRYRAMEWLTSDTGWDDVSIAVPCRA